MELKDFDFDNLAATVNVLDKGVVSEKRREVSRALAHLQMSATCDDSRDVHDIIKYGDTINKESDFVEMLRKYKDQILILIEELADRVEDIELAEEVL